MMTESDCECHDSVRWPPWCLLHVLATMVSYGDGMESVGVPFGLRDPAPSDGLKG